MRKFKIYSLSNFEIFNTILLTIVTTWYITVPWLIHFITGSLYRLTSLMHFAHLPLLPRQPPSVLCICEFVCFWSTVDIQHYVSSCYTVIWYFYTFQNNHHNKSSYDMSPFQRYCIVTSCLPYIVHFIPMTSFFSSPICFHFGNHLFVLLIYDSVFLCLFIHSFVF